MNSDKQEIQREKHRLIFETLSRTIINGAELDLCLKQAATMLQNGFVPSREESIKLQELLAAAHAWSKQTSKLMRQMKNRGLSGPPL
jgi:hypothetical protein